MDRFFSRYSIHLLNEYILKCLSRHVDALKIDRGWKLSLSMFFVLFTLSMLIIHHQFLVLNKKMNTNSIPQHVFAGYSFRIRILFHLFMFVHCFEPDANFLSVSVKFFIYIFVHFNFIISFCFHITAKYLSFPLYFVWFVLHSMVFWNCYLTQFRNRKRNKSFHFTVTHNCFRDKYLYCEDDQSMILLLVASTRDR